MDTETQLELILPEVLLNRTQWYTIWARFTKNGAPALVGSMVNISPSISFMDSRKRQISSDTGAGLTLNLVGVCSTTGGDLIKCDKCKKQDKIVTNRKRKRDVSTTENWNDKDDRNNEKLFHITSDGRDRVDSEGLLKLRLRVMCCVGSTRQFHVNHINDNEIPTHIHRECTGISLRINLELNGAVISSYTHKKDIRVIGKVPSTRKKDIFVFENPNLEPPASVISKREKIVKEEQQASEKTLHNIKTEEHIRVSPESNIQVQDYKNDQSFIGLGLSNRKDTMMMRSIGLPTIRSFPSGLNNMDNSLKPIRDNLKQNAHSITHLISEHPQAQSNANSHNDKEVDLFKSEEDPKQYVTHTIPNYNSKYLYRNHDDCDLVTVEDQNPILDDISSPKEFKQIPPHSLTVVPQNSPKERIYKLPHSQPQLVIPRRTLSYHEIVPQIPPDSISSDDEDEGFSTQDFSEQETSPAYHSRRRTAQQSELSDVDQLTISPVQNQRRPFSHQFRFSATADIVLDPKPTKWTVMTILDAMRIPLCKLNEIRTPINEYRIKIYNNYPIAYTPIFEENFTDLLLQSSDDPIMLLQVCNVVLAATLLFDKQDEIRMKTNRLILLAENIAKELIVVPVVNRSVKENVYLADAITRTAVLLVIFNRAYHLTIDFLHRSYLIYEYVAEYHPAVRKTPYYGILMWHKTCLHPDPSELLQGYEWAVTYNSPFLDHILFFLIVTKIYPKYYDNPGAVQLRLAAKEEQNYLLQLCTQFRLKSLLMEIALAALRAWITRDFDQALSTIEECTIQQHLMTKVSDPLPVQIVIWVSIQLYGIMMTNKSQWTDKIRLLGFIQSLRKLVKENIIRVWSMSLDHFNNNLLTQLTNIDSQHL